MAQALQSLLESLTADGALYDKLPDSAVRCYACGHRCYIREGGQGICKVRFNQGGTLRVPWGYVGALQCDPTEKKPFFHVYPGSDTLTFGMLGCDLHCSYCFPPETPVVTDRGVLPIGELFASGRQTARTADAEIAYPEGLRAITASGEARPVVQVFKHHYSGPLITLKPYYLPELHCTPDHRVYATEDPSRPPEATKAGQLTTRHYLAIPRRFAFSKPQVVNVANYLPQFPGHFKTPRQYTPEDIRSIMTASAEGVSSRELGALLGRNPSSIRHIRGKVRRGLWTGSKPIQLLTEDGSVRYSYEHRPGIPAEVALDENFARLLGLYCAEGSVTKSKSCPNSRNLVFTFGLHEDGLAVETRQLIVSAFGLEAQLVRRRTTVAVAIGKASLALLFERLCGLGAAGKRVPVQLFDAPRPVVQAFLDAYLQGDGHRYADGKSSVTTISRELAYGVAWLALKLGHLPSLYESGLPGKKVIEGRLVRQSTLQYTVVWYVDTDVERKFVQTDRFYLVPLRSTGSTDYSGDVYNLEVEGEHNYLASFLLVSNCQNWVTSQALRDPASEYAGASPQPVSAAQMVAYAKRSGARLVGSSYNEPLITSEWAVEVFKAARAEGLACAYISNGNLTPEVLDYLRPYLSAYKIDLKTMNDRRYRQLGAVLDNVLDGIRRVHAAGIWLEVVTLVIPGFNDSPAELLDAARFLASVSPDIPWHVTAFHPDYKMTAPDRTAAAGLLRAAEIGQEAGLHYVYAGNLPGQVGDYENTYCPACRQLLVGRSGYVITSYHLTADGRCPKCGGAVAGLWPKPAEVRLGTLADFYRRGPRRVGL